MMSTNLKTAGQEGKNSQKLAASATLMSDGFITKTTNWPTTMQTRNFKI